MFDRNIPLPPRSRWDFAQAQPGDSLAFPTRAEADNFGQAVRKYARGAGNGWGTTTAHEGEGWRVWIVGKQKERPPPSGIASIGIPVYGHMDLDLRPSAMVLSPLSTERDDDLALAVDTRRGEGIAFVAAAEAQAPEIEPEAEDAAPRRRRRHAAQAA